MNFSNFLHAALNRWKNDFFLMALFDWTSRCCTFTRVGGVKNRLFEKNCQKIPLFIRKIFFFIKGQILGRGGHVWATSQIRGDRSQIFEKFHDFWQFLVIFDFFSKMVDFWPLSAMIKNVWRWKIVGVYQGWLFMKATQKRDFWKKIVKKVEFLSIFSTCFLLN